MKSKISFSLLFVSVVIFLLNHAFAQNKSMESDNLLTVEKHLASINKITEVFNEYIPFPNVAADMIKHITRKLKNAI